MPEKGNSSVESEAVRKAQKPSFKDNPVFRDPFDLPPSADPTQNNISPMRNGATERTLLSGPKYVVSTIREHPDSNLRRLGIIRQKGQVSDKPVRFDAVRGWVDESSNTPIDLSNQGKSSQLAETREPTTAEKVQSAKAPPALKNRVDTVPKGVIWIIGPVDFQAPPKETLAKPVNMHEVDSMLRFRQQQSEADRSALTPVLAKVQTLVELPGTDDHQVIANMGNADADASVLTEAEVEKFVRQYLFRSIPSAAQQFGALVLTSDTGDLHRVLSGGMQSINDTYDVEGLVVCAESSVTSTTVKSTAFTHVLGLSEGRGENGSVVQRDVDLYIAGIAKELSRGYDPNWKAEQRPCFREAATPPKRAGVQTVAILFGGGVDSKFQVLYAVSQGWPVMIVDGSGGYADELCGVLRSQMSDTLDETQRAAILCKVDPETFDIASKGTCIIVEKGQVVDTFTMSVGYALKGDGTVKLAWKKYAQWNAAARYYHLLFRWLLTFFVFLSSVSTGLSVVLTFMQVYWPTETAAGGGTKTSIGQVFTGLSIVVIFLPIMLGMVQFFVGRINAGGKWAALRYASECLMREIYCMRFEGGEYSRDNVRRAAALVKRLRQASALARRPQSDHDIPQYSTRQELLHCRMHQLTLELFQSLDNGVIKPYDGPVPPPNTVIDGDDGVSDLDADQYITFRLQTRIAWFIKHAKIVTTERVVIEFLVHVLNTGGTVCGALSTYSALTNLNLQSWVAVTTSIVNALTRLEHWMILEWQQQKYTQTYLRLYNVVSWWSSRGSKTSDAIRQKLCSKVEKPLTEENTEFRQQFRSADGRLGMSIEGAQEEEEDAMISTKSPEELAKLRDAKRRVQEMSFDLITQENIAAATADPKSSIARKLKQLMNQINSELGDVVQEEQQRRRDDQILVMKFLAPATRFAEIKNAVMEPLEGVPTPVSLLLTSPLRKFQFRRLLSKPLVDFRDTQHKRILFLRALQHAMHAEVAMNLRMEDYSAMIAQVDPVLHEEFLRVPVRVQLEAIQSVLEEDAMMQLKASLLEAKINHADVKPKGGSLSDTIMQLYPIASIPWRLLDAESIYTLIGSQSIRALLRSLPEPKLRSMLKRVEAFFMQDSDPLNAERDILNQMAELDVMNDIIATPEERLATLDMRAAMAELSFDPAILCKESLVKLFTPELQPHVEDLEQPRLARCVRLLGQPLAANTTLTAALSKLYIEFDNLVDPEEAALRKQDKQYLEAALWCEAKNDLFATFATSLTQGEVFSIKKELLMKKFLGSCVGAKDVVAKLNHVRGATVQRLISMILGAKAHTFPAQIFDDLSKEMIQFDPAQVLNFENQNLFLRRLKELRGLDPSNLTKESILKVAAFRPLILALKDLSLEQLQEMVQRAQLVSCPIFTAQSTMDIISGFRLTAHQEELLAYTSPIELDRLNTTMALIDVKEMKRLELSLRAACRGNLEDEARMSRSITQSFLRMIPDNGVRSLVSHLQFSETEIYEYCARASVVVGDVACLSLLRDVTIEADFSLMTKIDACMGHANDRQLLVESVTDLIRKKYLSWEILGQLQSLPPSRVYEHFCRERMELHDTLHRVLGSDYGIFVISVASNCIVNSTVYLFNEIACRISSFDLKGLIPARFARALYLPLLFKILVLLSKHPAGVLSFEKFYEDSWTALRQLPAKAFVSTCHHTGNRIFECVHDSLRLLSDENFSTLMETTYLVMKTSPVGRLFRSMCTDGHESFAVEGFYESKLRLIPVMIQSHIRTQPHVLREVFDDFDAKTFASRPPEVRLAAIRRFVTHEVLSDAANEFTKEQWHRLFISFRTHFAFARMHFGGLEAQGQAAHLSSISKTFRAMANVAVMTARSRRVSVQSSETISSDVSPGVVPDDAAVK